MKKPLIFLFAAFTTYAATIEMDSARGRKVFETEACITCHSINGQGGHTGPDLGRLLDRSFTPAALASTMWNHAPTMWAAMAGRGARPESHLDEQAASDLFAYFYSTRFFEKPGDAGRGKRVFREKGCERCHGLTQSPNVEAPPVSRWSALGDPVGLAQAMWNHSGSMRAELDLRHMSWPELTSQDLADLLVYCRNLPASAPRQSIFIATNGAGGAKLFEVKGCKACHDPSTLLKRTGLAGKTLSDVAAAMWNHAPLMRTPAAHFDSDEMRELISYLWANQYFEVTGNVDRGRKVFVAKRCVICHDGGAGAPDLTKRATELNGSGIVSVLWKHGPVMNEQMKLKNIPWPRFDSREMSDLIGYLNSRRR